MTAERIRAVVVDVEGTVLPVTFVAETLFPFARARLGRFLREHKDDPAVAEALADTARLSGMESVPAEDVLKRWMDEDRKVTPLKTIQGLIWADGYAEGLIKAMLYPEVADRLRAWRAAGLRLFVYSSGSVLAQTLLFSHTTSGDLTPLFDGFFDTHIGAKTDPASYAVIQNRLALPGQAILFLSDSEKELDAAAAAGFVTTLIARDGPVASRYPVHRDFSALGI